MHKIKVVAALVALSIFTVLIAGIRFNRSSVPFSDSEAAIPADHVYYGDLVRHFRGEPAIHTLTRPYSERLLAPWVASWLPFNPQTALNVVNVLVLLLALLLLYNAMIRFHISVHRALLGCCLFVFSFPVFYYGAIGYVDPVLIGWLALFVYGLSRGSDSVLFVSMLGGVLTRESMLLMLPAFLVFQFRSRSNFVRPALMLGVVLIALIVLPEFVPAEADHSHPPNLEWTLANLTNARSWLALLLSSGLTGVLLLVHLAHRERRQQMFRSAAAPELISGVVGGVLLTLAAFTVAIMDGRFIWTIYPFAIPLVMMSLPSSGVPEKAECPQ